MKVLISDPISLTLLHLQLLLLTHQGKTVKGRIVAQVKIKGGGTYCLSAVHDVAALLSVLLPYSLSACEQAEKLGVLDHAFSVTSMSESIGQ